MDVVTTQGPFAFPSCRLAIIGEPTYEEWVTCGEFIKNVDNSVHFLIGDWLNYAETKWGEKYKEAEEITGSSQLIKENKETSASSYSLLTSAVQNGRF